MVTASISRLKAKMHEYIALVRSGEEILVTQRGKAVARIMPIEAISNFDTKRIELSCRGILKLGKGHISDELLKDLPVVNISDEDIFRISEWERAESS